MDQLPLENFENNRIELLFCQNTLIGSFCQKLVSCGENGWLWEKGEFLKSLISFCFVKILILALFVKSWSLVGRMVDYGKKGEFLKSLINFSWNTSLYVSTSEFDFEIGNWVWFTKTNQVVAKSDPYMPNLNQNNLEFSFALILHLF
jgi:hypothetical protein